MITLTDQELYQASGAGTSQCARILARLMQTPGEWVPMPELAEAGSGKPRGWCMVHSRVADLRKRGHVIEQEGAHESRYRLIENPKAEGQSHEGGSNV